MALNACCAEENRALNGAANVVVLPAAAAEQRGTLQFEDGGGSHMANDNQEWTTTTVEAVTVDVLASGVLTHFPADRYDVVVRDAADGAEFVPVEADVFARTSRFFLVARARRNEA